MCALYSEIDCISCQALASKVFSQPFWTRPKMISWHSHFCSWLTSVSRETIMCLFSGQILNVQVDTNLTTKSVLCFHCWFSILRHQSKMSHKRLLASDYFLKFHQNPCTNTCSPLLSIKKWTMQQSQEKISSSRRRKNFQISSFQPFYCLDRG